VLPSSALFTVGSFPFSKPPHFSNFSFQCGGEYHAPTDCDTIKRWLTKCADDSETANYISAHTKDVSSSPKKLFQADNKWWGVRERTQGILNGEVSLHRWPPVWLVWNQLYDNWQFLFLFAKQTNPKQSNRRSTVQWYFPPLVHPGEPENEGKSAAIFCRQVTVP
jgi:hypothetical protein